MTRRVGVATSGVLIVVGLCGCDRDGGHEGHAAAGGPAIDPQVLEMLSGLSKRVVRSASLSVNVDCEVYLSEDVSTPVRESRYVVAFERPRRFAIRPREGSGGTTVIADGRRISIHLPALGRYTQREQEGDMNETAAPGILRVLTMSDDGVRAAGAFLLNDPAADMLDGVIRASYAGEEHLEGRAVHRLRFEQEEFDWTLWVSGDAHHLPVRVDFDPPKSSSESQRINAGQMRIRVRFSDWKLDGPLPAGLFEWSPPPSATGTSGPVGDQNPERP